MPQTTAEEKFFLTRADNFFQNTTFKISKSFSTAEFARYEGVLKNITGGEG